MTRDVDHVQATPPPLSWWAIEASDHRPALRQLPATTCAWRLGARVGGWWRGLAFLPIEGRWCVATMPTRPAVTGDKARLVLRSGDVTVVATPHDVARWAHPRTRAGADAVLHRDGPRWTGVDGLPDAAAVEATTRPFAVGTGVTWRADGLLYRWTPEAGIAPVGTWRGADAVVDGPHGAVALATSGTVERAAAASGTVQPLSVPLDAGSLRWSPDGSRLVGRVAGGDDVVVHDLVRRRTRWHEDGWPVDARLILGEAPDARLAPLARALPQLAPVVDGDVLDGPGGRRWSLVDGADVGTATVARTAASPSPDDVPTDWASLGVTHAHRGARVEVGWHGDGLVVARRITRR